MGENKLLIATHNQGKVREFRRLLARIEARLLSLTDLGISAQLDETRETFQENAVEKACGYARIAGLPTLADDSGLMIDHLGGDPGVRSARFAGNNASDRDRIAAVLNQLLGVSDDKRSARFVCALSVANEKGDLLMTVEGKCEGTITRAARGSDGFGYDPIFQPVGSEKTFGELDASVKNEISHRADAITKIIPFLRGFFNDGT